MFGFYWSCFKNYSPTSVESFEWFSVFFILFDCFSPEKVETFFKLF